MDKSEIVERIAREVTNAQILEQTGRPNGWNMIGDDGREKVMRDVESVLTAAGYFDLLEAARKARFMVRSYYERNGGEEIKRIADEYDEALRKAGASVE